MRAAASLGEREMTGILDSEDLLDGVVFVEEEAREEVDGIGDDRDEDDQ